MTSSLSFKCVLSIVSGLLLGAGFFNSQLYMLTWFAYVPLLWALKNASCKESYVFGFLAGLSCYVFAAYWVVDFIVLIKRYPFGKSFLLGIVFWVYSAQLVALIAMLFRWLSLHSRFHPLILFSVITACFYGYFPMLFSCQLGESQSRFTLALQAIDVVGVSGLDVLIAMVNYMLFSALFERDGHRSTGRTKLIYGAAGCLILGWFVYSAWALHYWRDTIAGWDHLQVGLVQPNEKPESGRAKVFPGYSRAYPAEMDMTERLVANGAELVVWPEARYKRYFDEPGVADMIRGSVAQLKTPLLFQDMEKKQTNLRGESILRNGAAFLNAAGEPQPTYYKMKRVAFGEYVPLARDFPELKALAEQFFGDFTQEIESGPGRVQYQTEKFSLIPLICYEVMFPEFVANAVPDDARGYILITLSSNGWFGETIQPYQHVHSGALRAVENRLPLIHALNNGPSTVVLPDGSFFYEGEYHKGGGYLVSMPYSKQDGGSWFSRHPYLFSVVMGFILAAAVVSAVSSVIVSGKANRSFVSA
ncbi:apolipoprotein N-acyltransferase [Ketobacter sp.]|nr:MAG: apolipoprotein N-acyltransferase [Ketobacter sp.]